MVLAYSMSHRTKLLCNRSNCCLDLAICDFHIPSARSLVFYMRILQAVFTQKAKIRRLPNFLAIGQTVAKL